MTLAKLKDVKIVLLMSALTFALIIGSCITTSNIFDFLYIIFILFCGVRYIIIVKDN